MLVLIHTEQELIEQRQALAVLIRNRLDRHLFIFEGNERLKMVFDLEMHLAFLGEAVRCGISRIFSEYAVWSHQLLVSSGGDSQRFKDCLLAIDEQLKESGTGQWRETARRDIEMALSQLDKAQLIAESYLTSDNPYHSVAEAFLKNCLILNRKQALEQIHNAVQNGTSVIDIYLYVITPVMRELGRLWHLNKITIGQEHYCTALAQMVMSQLFPWIFDGAIKTKRLVSTCVAGELHEIGARMVSDLFEMQGWDTVFLGADVPLESVIDTVIQYDANILAISVTLGCHLSAVSDMVAALRANPCCRNVKVLVGGAAFNVDSSLWQVIGADGWAEDAQIGIALANQWSQPS